MIGCFVVSGICFALQVISWIGGSMRGRVSYGGVYGTGYSIGSNLLLIIAVVFLIIGFILKKRKE